MIARQTPASQDSFPAQTMSQLPQCSSSVCGSEQALPHRACPAGHSQAPLLQVCPVAHLTPQRPQFAASLCPSTQSPEQAKRLLSHVQLPSEHV
jgi:hypothetical protein